MEKRCFGLLGAETSSLIGSDFEGSDPILRISLLDHVPSAMRIMAAGGGGRLETKGRPGGRYDIRSREKIKWTDGIGRDIVDRILLKSPPHQHFYTPARLTETFPTSSLYFHSRSSPFQAPRGSLFSLLCVIVRGVGQGTVPAGRGLNRFGSGVLRRMD